MLIFLPAGILLSMGGWGGLVSDEQSGGSLRTMEHRTPSFITLEPLLERTKDRTVYRVGSSAADLVAVVATMQRRRQ